MNVFILDGKMWMTFHWIENRDRVFKKHICDHELQNLEGPLSASCFIITFQIMKMNFPIIFSNKYINIIAKNIYRISNNKEQWAITDTTRTAV